MSTSHYAVKTRASGQGAQHSADSSQVPPPFGLLRGGKGTKCLRADACQRLLAATEMLKKIYEEKLAGRKTLLDIM